MNVVLNGEALEEVKQFKHLGSIITVNDGMEEDACYRMNEGCKVLDAMRKMMQCTLYSIRNEC